MRLPVGAGSEDAHVPIFATTDLPRRSRVVIVIGESTQDLGVLAYRVVGGRGGIDAGSIVGFAKSLQAKHHESVELLKHRQHRQKLSGNKNAAVNADTPPPGLVLANTGQLWWWPDGRRALNQWSRDAVPMPTAVQWGHKTLEENCVPGNRTVAEHVGYLFGQFLPKVLSPDARIDIVAVGDGCDAVQAFLDQEWNWETWGLRLNSLVIAGGLYDGTNCNVNGFREFLRHVRFPTSSFVIRSSYNLFSLPFANDQPFAMP